MSKENKKALDAEITSTLIGESGQLQYLAVTHWKAIVGTCVAIVVGVALFFSVNAWNKHQAANAANALCGATTEAALLKALGEFGDNPAARFARLRLGRIYIDKKEFAKAADQFALILKSDPPQEMRYRVSIDEAYLRENAGNAAQAAAMLSAIAKSPSVPAALRAESGYGAGRIYLSLNDKAKAAEFLDLSRKQLPNVSQAAVEWCRLAQFLQINNNLAK